MNTKELCETYINGNITDAKASAKRNPQFEIEACLIVADEQRRGNGSNHE